MPAGSADVRLKCLCFPVLYGRLSINTPLCRDKWAGLGLYIFSKGNVFAAQYKAIHISYTLDQKCTTFKGLRTALSTCSSSTGRNKTSALQCSDHHFFLLQTYMMACFLQDELYYLIATYWDTYLLAFNFYNLV